MGNERKLSVAESWRLALVDPTHRGEGAVGTVFAEIQSLAGRPVETVTQLLIERRPGGAILRVTGVADRLGPFDVKLVEDEANPDPATLSYTLSALQQPGPRSTGEWARTVTAAVWLTDQDLAGISAIRVAGRTNVQVSRR